MADPVDWGLLSTTVGMEQLDELPEPKPRRKHKRPNYYPNAEHMCPPDCPRRSGDCHID